MSSTWLPPPGWPNQQLKRLRLGSTIAKWENPYPIPIDGIFVPLFRAKCGMSAPVILVFGWGLNSQNIEQLGSIPKTQFNRSDSLAFYADTTLLIIQVSGKLTNSASYSWVILSAAGGQRMCWSNPDGIQMWPTTRGNNPIVRIMTPGACDRLD